MVCIAPHLSKEEVAFRIHREWQRKKAAVATPERPYGLRTIARHLAHRHDVPKGVDAATAIRSRLRQLQRYVAAEHMPSAAYLELLAEEFGCDAECLGVVRTEVNEEGDDDPPSSSVDRDLLSQVRAMKRFQAQTARQLRELERLVATR